MDNQSDPIVSIGITPTVATHSPTMHVRQGPGNAANLQIRQSTLCCSISIADTRPKFELQESHVRAIKSGLVNDAVVVNFHIASIANRYAEECPGPSRTVFVLPSTIFSGWKTKTLTNPASEIVKSYDFLKSKHIAFPYYWEPQGRWLLVVLAGFNDLLGHENVSEVNAADLNFGFILLDAQQATTKTQYSPLVRTFRDFTTALLTPQLDVHHAAIAGAKITIPFVCAAAAIFAIFPCILTLHINRSPP